MRNMILKLAGAASALSMAANMAASPARARGKRKLYMP